MSKIGKLPVKVPAGVKVALSDGQLTISGPKGSLTQKIHRDIIVKVEGNNIVVSRPSDHRLHRSLHGLTRALIQNMVTGVTKGYSVILEMIGVGYRAEIKGKLIELNLGYSHSILLRPPDGVAMQVLPKEGRIIVSGADKQLVGLTAAKIRSFKPPEPYKGKGIRYLNEVVRRKAGKAAAGAK
jgi:large subunit ribosomal protein L6